MDRGLVVGGALICASFLVAVALNHSRKDREEVQENAPTVQELTPAPKSSKCSEAPLVEGASSGAPGPTPLSCD